MINSFEVENVSKEDTIKIAHILSTIDDKIELNRKMNQTLEAMAQALFKSWFVDFEPVQVKAGCDSDEELEAVAKELGISKEVLELFPSEFVESEMRMIPLGWEASAIEDEVTIYGGATPSTKEDKYWVDGDNHWATPRDLSGLNSKILIDTGRKITNDGVNKISSKQLPIGTVLLSSRAPVGYIAYSTVPISINQGFIAMACKKKLSNYFIIYWLDIAMNEIKSRAIGTTFAEISKSAFRPIKLVVASDEILSAFDVIIAPMVNKIIANEYEIETLIKTRDTLLPKLLSGELDVSKITTNKEN
jgi:type I restriction enzyme S subunit